MEGEPRLQKLQVGLKLQVCNQVPGAIKGTPIQVAHKGASSLPAPARG